MTSTASSTSSVTLKPAGDGGAVSGTNEATRSVAVGGKSGFNPVLDGIRGMAILLVMLYHMTVMDQLTWFDGVFKTSMAFGWVGVDLFFVLSGFLITGILWDSKHAAGDASRAKAGAFFGNFYARRTLRIFPLYYAMVFLWLVVVPHLLPMVLSHVSNPAKAELLMTKIDRFGHVRGYEYWFWLYLSNVPMALKANFLHVVLGVSWSLAIEEQFYLVWPAVVFFCSRGRLMRVCVWVFAAALIWRVAIRYWFGANHVAVYVSTPSRMDALVAGAFLAMLVRRPGGIDLRRLARRARPLGVAAAMLGLGIAVTEMFVSPEYRPDDGIGIGHTSLFLTVGLTMLSVVFGAVLLSALASPKGGLMNRVFTLGPLRTLGKYAYALYLFHQPIRAFVRDLVFGPIQTAAIKFPVIMGTQLAGQLVYYVLCIGLTLAAAMVSWRLFENPILKLKHYFPSGAEEAVRKAGAPTSHGKAGA